MFSVCLEGLWGRVRRGSGCSSAGVDRPSTRRPHAYVRRYEETFEAGYLSRRALALTVIFKVRTQEVWDGIGIWAESGLNLGQFRAG